MHRRFLDLRALLARKSLFFLGPRNTGKTTLARVSFSGRIRHDLLDNRTYRRLLCNPDLLGEGLDADGGVVIVDEVARIPDLLHEVHRLIEGKGARFLLVESNARRLKRKGVNLLGGRASMACLFPLVSTEIPKFNLLRHLNWGGLPGICDSPDPEGALQHYASRHLVEEVRNEAPGMRMWAFLEFLDAMALANGREINLQEPGGRPSGFPQLRAKLHRHLGRHDDRVPPARLRQDQEAQSRLPVQILFFRSRRREPSRQERRDQGGEPGIRACV